MKPAFKVAGSRSYHSGNPIYGGLPPQRYYQVSGVWPRYEVQLMWDEATRQVLWGRRALKAFEVTMRIEGYKRFKVKTTKGF